jgi:hypothetical protein
MAAAGVGFALRHRGSSFDRVSTQHKVSRCQGNPCDRAAQGGWTSLLSGLNLRRRRVTRLLLRFRSFSVGETLKIADAVKVPERFITSCRHARTRCAYPRLSCLFSNK